MASSSFSSTNQDSELISDNDENLSWIYDLFLSFCDKDATKSFAYNLDTALTEAGIVVFRDGDKLRNQDQMITPSVLHAIEMSRVSIVVFSKNYADSTWCLQELEKILECYRTADQMVLPVVHDDEDMLEETFMDLAVRILKKVEPGFEDFDISGFSVVSRNESEYIKDIVEHVNSLLDRTYLFVADHPVGVDSRVQDVIQLLNSQESKDPVLIGLWGMAGIGKTTIAKAVYNQIRYDFEGNSFLLNVAKNWKQYNGKVSLQRQLLSDIYKTKQKIMIDTVESGKLILQERLCQKRILLVLDDVSELDQLNALCGSPKCFGQGSKIIITSRDPHILHAHYVNHVYEIKSINQYESLQLFSWHAFEKPSPMHDFSDLSRDFIDYFRGVPLVIQVIGSFLLTSRSKTLWISVLEKLKCIPNDNVIDKLRISYDGLRDNDMKDIFLDIAQFLIGMDLKAATKILKDSELSVDIGMSILVQQNLVTVDRMNKIGMHDLLEDMASEIIRRKSERVDKKRIYDVFLSFRGEDCRANFISHLYTSLQIAGIYVFKDDAEIQQGDQISASLLEAIGQSRICIVVLSSNYANSRWCMIELEKIMDRSNSLVVIPVFYEVDPSEVRHQTGRFGEGFKNLLSGISVNSYREMKWKTALLKVGGTSGVVVINSRNESEDIRKIVNDVTKLLDITDLFVADHPVGVDSRVQDIIQLLNNQESNDPLLLGILGMGGIGKTTIAKGAYNKIRHNFEAKSFLLNVREIWEQDNGKVSLQQRLLSDIYKTTKINIDTVESGKMILQEKLRQKRIFLVLDDVNKLDQLNALCGSHEWFGEGSRIIITTRDGDLLHGLKVDHVYRMKKMNGDESLQLFSWNAFKEPSPIDGFAGLSRDFVKYCGGLPLALQVIGSFLMTKRRKIEWKSVLEKLKLIPNEEVLEKLRISFDGLNDYDMKEIFLDIAFFFIGMDQEDVTKILEDCGHYAGIGISVLVQRSLVTVDSKNKIGMHELLQDMGREIVSKISREGNKDPSRLWRYEDVNSLLSKDTRTLYVKGLTLKISRMDSTTYLDSKTFEKMDKLKLLQLAGIKFNGNYKYISRELRWLCWHGFPLKYTPTDFHQERLVSVDFKYSNLERVWKKSQFLKGLKFLNLSHSHNLRQTPDFSNLPNLEKLILKDCPSLSSISPTIGHLKKILLINLKDCTGLRELPRSIYKLESLKTLIVSGCTKIVKLEEDIEQMTSLTTLVADNTALTRVPFAVVKSKSIGYISLCGFKGSPRNVFPLIIQSWMSPTNGMLSLVQTFAGTSSLEFFDEQEDIFFGLPSILKELPNLQRLLLKCGSDTQLNQTLASILDNLHTQSCEELEAMQNIPQSSNFVALESAHYFSQVRISSSQKSLTSLLIQMGMNCHVTNTLRENILQKLPPNGSGLLPSDNYPDWLAFNEKGSSVTFEVPQVDERNLKTIMCIVYSSSLDDITSESVEDLKVLLLINFTKKTIQLYKKDALLASFDEEEWQKVVSSTEPGDIMKLIVVFGSKIVVKKTTVYFIYDEPIDEKTKHCPEPDKNIIIFGRLLFRLPSLVQAALISRPFWFCLAVMLIWWIRFCSNKHRSLRKWLPKALKVSAIQYRGTKFLWVMYNKILNCCRRG
ncbi:disease resistance protein RUN1-like isoform X2 [Vicia villosa]|uniref:disease resistance protein RUN1-like isoform X2 n=1 Tax=Vicia villosa TaxID=3911 RepID=UPI00273CC07A|nr:disease resistance protein RUN1-like isoform X2 [Vicia villosa]